MDNLLYRYLYTEFLENYTKQFDIIKPTYGNIKNARYTWQDPDYNRFMGTLVSHLEPIKYEKKGIILLDELEEVNEVIFIIDEFYHVGFSINKVVHLKLKQKQAMIGDYNLTFNQRSQYVYKTSCACHGFFIRRKNWLSIFGSEELKEITSLVKENIQKKYNNAL